MRAPRPPAPRLCYQASPEAAIGVGFFLGEIPGIALYLSPLGLRFTPCSTAQQPAQKPVGGIPVLRKEPSPTVTLLLPVALSPHNCPFPCPRSLQRAPGPRPMPNAQRPGPGPAWPNV